MGRFEKTNARVRIKRTWLFVAGTLLLVVGFGPVVGLMTILMLSHTLLALLVVLGHLTASFALLYAWSARWLERSGTVRADADGLFIDNELAVTRDSVRRGYVHEKDGEWLVRLGRTIRMVDIVVADEAEGNALLRAMRLDASSSVAEYPMNHGSAANAWKDVAILMSLWFVTTFGGLFGFESASYFIPALLAWVPLIVVWALRQIVRVSVGADGIQVRRMLAGSRYVPFHAIEKAETDGRTVTLRLRDGTTIEMHQTGNKNVKPILFGDRVEEAEKLVERINARIRELHHAGGDVNALAHDGKDARTWMRDVALASDEHADFRAPAVPPDELWRVVEDPSTSATTRAGAAVALRKRLDDDGRARLRVLADACAAPKLRVALQAAASTATDDEIEDAFAELVEDEARLRMALR